MYSGMGSFLLFQERAKPGSLTVIDKIAWASTGAYGEPGINTLPNVRAFCAEPNSDPWTALGPPLEGEILGIWHGEESELFEHILVVIYL
jgi:hypothetical protein